jgi:hypothetical protein
MAPQEQLSLLLYKAWSKVVQGIWVKCYWVPVGLSFIPNVIDNVFIVFFILRVKHDGAQ